MTWNDSNHHFGLTIVRSRPADISPRWSTGFCTLSAFADREMGVARHGISDGTKPDEIRRRLCKFWGRLSRQILVDRMEQDVVCVLGDLSQYEYEAAGIWLDGLWHHNGMAMARILWHLQCSDRLVSAAVDLHRRVSLRNTDEEETSRTGKLMSIMLGASLIGTRIAIVTLLCVTAIVAVDGPPTQAEQDEIWRKAMEESRQAKPRVPPSALLPKQPALKPVAVPAPAPPRPETDYSALLICSAGVVLIAMVMVTRKKKEPWARRSGDPTGSPRKRGVSCGNWLTTNVRIPPMRTPLGGRVTVLSVQVDIDYSVSEADEIQVHRVTMCSDADFNVASPRTGEAFRTTSIDRNLLLAAVATDLATDGNPLRGRLLREWRESTT